MEKIIIKPSKLKGTVNIPSSKSLSHRAIICGSLCEDENVSVVDNIILSEDIRATIEGMRKLGARIDIIENTNGTYRLYIRGSQGSVEESIIDCNESGSTLRFLIPTAMMLSKKTTFLGKGKLVERPLDIYYKIFDEKNIEYTNMEGKLPLTVRGKLEAGDYYISGKVSSQFITGLLFALALEKGKSSIIIEDNLESKGYVDLSLDMLRKFNINIENKEYKEFIIPENSTYKSYDYKVEGDYSQAAFFLASKGLGNDVECFGLNEDSLQGDKAILHVIDRFKIHTGGEIIIDASEIPDLVPIIAVLASLKSGVVTKIINAERVRLKESDRLKAIATELGKLGADIRERKDGLEIRGKSSLKGDALVNSWNDHRIAMSLAIAATCCEEGIILEDYMSINKSYPMFWEDYKSLGGIIHELHMGK